MTPAAIARRRVDVSSTRLSSLGRRKELWSGLTKNRRYEAHYDALNDERILQGTTRRHACTLGSDAYGPQPIQWAPRGQLPKVWAWISWANEPASRIPAEAAGWNDRIVIVEWEDAGGRRSVVVWRNAVTRRSPEQR